MRTEILRFIAENRLSPWNRETIPAPDDLYRTRDAKSVHSRIISRLSSGFHFECTKSIFSLFSNPGDVRKKQDFFRQIPVGIDKGFLNGISVPKPFWKPDYSAIAVTENEKTFMKLRSLSIPVQQILSPDDVRSLDSYELVQCIDCDEYKRVLEELPQGVFIDSIDDIYLERYLILLSGWKKNLDVLGSNMDSFAFHGLDSELRETLGRLIPFLDLADSKKNRITHEHVDEKLGEINNELSVVLKDITIRGDSLYEMLSRNSLPQEVGSAISSAIRKTGLPSHIFRKAIPVSVDEEALKELIQRQEAQENTTFAEKLKRNASGLKSVPADLERISSILLLFDFASGLSPLLSGTYPDEGDGFSMKDSRNLFLDSPQPVSFYLNHEERCSILTGANSGGKTTLLEHIIQVITMFNLGLPVPGKAETPRFSEVYYFAKNKGSMSKGAFETLLTQMSRIAPGNRTLILADEIESVTEPGVAGDIIRATVEYFAEKGCYMVVATHLGQEIVKSMPRFSRVDGIEAKGLDDKYNLIVDHSPVLGRLAHSTPELIIERMANTKKSTYLSHLYKSIKENKK